MTCSSRGCREPWRTVAGAVITTAAASGAFWTMAAPRTLGALPRGLLTLATVAGACYTHLAPCGPGVPPPLPGILPRAPWIALTFDDGPQVPATDSILDSLAAAGVHATFFVLGERARAHPDLIRRIAAEGHTLGIHGERHETVVFHSDARLRRSVTAVQAAIEAAHPGASASFFRPPWGLRRPGLVRLLRRHGLHLALWNLDSRDYAAASASATVARVLRLAAPGRVILMHDGGPGAAHTPVALPAILQGLAAKDLRCLSLAELMGAAATSSLPG